MAASGAMQPNASTRQEPSSIVASATKLVAFLSVQPLMAGMQEPSSKPAVGS